ncbi:glycosyltransferase BC10 [Benincasa hispida]|uniref:glycosyltransferase BC10 n=1 Tax=Benincasa hispida TaxID=102211 RepID=UPI0018FF9F8A|nr:glycosyltransferase BC10 [Benincasa hispida]
MLSPSLYLICVTLLCLPLAILFTINIPTTIHSINSSAYPFIFPFQSLYTSNLIPSPPPPPPPEDDDLLFPLAALVNSTPSPTHKLAFLFLTNSPLPFAPLWELFFKNIPPDLYNIYIHADPTRDYDVPFSGVFAHRVIPSKPTQRFSPSLSAAARRLLAHALLHDSSNSMFALLSPSCIPLHSFNFTYRTLFRSKKSFIEVLKSEIGAYDRWAARGPDVMLPVVKLADFRIGSQFWVLKRRHARIVASDQRVWPKFELPCVRRDTCYPEENYFPTLLSMWDQRGLVPATLTHVDWNGSFDGHPRTYLASEVGPKLIRGLRMARPRYGDDGRRMKIRMRNRRNVSAAKSHRRHPFLFARKFSAASLQRLMNISSDFIFQD